MSDRMRHVIGCMTGTSLDGLDAALVEITGEGLEMSAKFVDMVSIPLGDLAATLRSFAEGNAHPPIDFLRAARQLGDLHADAVETLLKRAGPSPAPDAAQPRSRTTAKPDFVVAHGQTIWHAPRERVGASGGGGGLSWQLFDPWPIVRRCGVPVCYDLRQADLVADGEGAPITPIADWVMYRSDDPVRVILNLGGIANATCLYDVPELTSGSDICACNIIIDGFVRACFPLLTFDRDGDIARRGYVEESAYEVVRQKLAADRTQRRSLGRETFSPEFFRTVTENDLQCGSDEEDVVHSALAAVLDTVDEWLRAAGPYRVVLAGGGARNKYLVECFQDRGRLARYHVTMSDELGIPVEAREAMAFAVLGALSQDGVPITLPQVTGANMPGRAGAWAYP